MRSACRVRCLYTILQLCSSYIIYEIISGIFCHFQSIFLVVKKISQSSKTRWYVRLGICATLVSKKITNNTESSLQEANIAIDVLRCDGRPEIYHMKSVIFHYRICDILFIRPLCPHITFITKKNILWWKSLFSRRAENYVASHFFHSF